MHNMHMHIGGVVAITESGQSLCVHHTTHEASPASTRVALFKPELETWQCHYANWYLTFSDSTARPALTVLIPSNYGECNSNSLGLHVVYPAEMWGPYRGMLDGHGLMNCNQRCPALVSLM